MRRVAIVDNDAITRAGTEAVLAHADGIEVVLVADHNAALAFDEGWRQVDVAVVDAADGRRLDGDQFPGVAVVRSIRRIRGREELTVVVLTGQTMHAGLRRRMWEAGADFFYGRDEGMDAAELVGVVLRPSEHRRMDQVLLELPTELGVGSDTKVNEVIDRLEDLGADGALARRAAKKNAGPNPRSRWWDKLRSGAAGRDGLTPTKATGDEAFDQAAPSLPQLRKFWSAMTKVRDANE